MLGKEVRSSLRVLSQRAHSLLVQGASMLAKESLASRTGTRREMQPTLGLAHNVGALLTEVSCTHERGLRGGE